MISFPHDIIPCLPRENYSVGRDPAVTSQTVIAGPSRNRWVNDAPSYLVNATLDIDHAQYAAWQSFFAAINHGQDWFQMDVDVEGVRETRQCHLRAMYSAQLVAADHWKVTLPLEVRLIDAAA